jgi:tetratricopeptide (TPR) repeat protein
MAGTEVRQCPVCGASSVVAGACTTCGARVDAALAATGELTTSEIAPLLPAETDPLLARGEFGDRYQLIARLGTGGAGTVYHAKDRLLDIPVALKVLKVSDRPGHTAEGERRLRQELLLARKITHKNVVRIHDLGQAHGVSYITMPYIKGQDLASLLERHGPLPIARALRLARQVVAGLAAAHEAGIVHRDLKPGNILIDESDQAIIVDFGIAYTASTTLSTMTAEGVIKGTVAYMAPEQALGSPVDARTDVYSFGLVLYEMLAGLRDTSDSGSLQELIQRTKHAPPPVRSLRDQVPAALDTIVSRCLEPDPADRFQTSGELTAALDALDAQGRSRAAADVARPATPEPAASPTAAVAPDVVRLSKRRAVLIAAAAGLVVSLGVAGWFWQRRDAPAPTTAPRQLSILVANFANGTGEAVFDGTVEEALTIGLESASFLNAFSRRDAARLATIVSPGAALDEQTARLVAIREGIDLVIGGSVERNGSGYRLRVRGVNPDSGASVAEAERTVDGKDRALETIGDLAKDVRRALGDVPAEATESGAAPETFTAATLEAAHAYTEAQQLANAGRDEDAVAAYKRVVALDPNFGRAFSGLGVSYRRLGRMEDARAAWNTALSLVDRMTERERYRTLGLYAQQMAGNYEQAIENNRALVERYPGDSTGFNNLAVSYFNTLDFARALDAGRRAIALNPQRVRYRANEALFAMYASDFDGARRAADEAIKLDPTYFQAYLPIAMAAIDAGDLAGATVALGRMAQAGRSGASLAAAGFADLALFADRVDEARERLSAAIASDRDAGNTLGATAKSFALAEAHIAAGRADEATALVEKTLATSRRDTDLVAAARLLMRAGRRPHAAKLAAELGGRLPSHARAYARLVEGWLAVDTGRTTDAVATFLEARKIADLWLTRLSLGIAYVHAGAYAEALSELDACQRRRGEAMAVFLDDVPTARYLTPLPYWLGRAQEGLGQQAAARASYQRFLSRRADASSDPLAADTRRRLATLN